MHARHAVFFGPFRLDPVEQALWKGEEPVRFQKTPLRVLVYLIERANRLVTKEELQKAVWGETVVSDAAIAKCIDRARRTLGDNAKNPIFIAVVPRRGYRFIAKILRGSSATLVPHVSAPDGEPQTSHMVGRTDEVKKLRQWLDKARRGRRQTVFVAGERGVGKTAVVNAFTSQIAAEGAVWIGYGHCAEEYSPREPYRPILDALQQLCRQDTDGRILTHLQAHAPLWVQELPALVSSGERAALRPKEGDEPPIQRMPRELAEALEALSRERPLILILEDLHWSDLATLDAVGYLARRQEDARLLVIGTYRPEEAQTQNSPPTTLRQLEAMTAELGSHRQCDILPVDLLTEAAVREYLAETWGDAPFMDDLARRIYEHTEGNALFMTHVVEDLARQGIVEATEGKWSLKKRVSRIKIPLTLQALIEKEMKQLPETEQRVLEGASVAGMTFVVAAVAAALEQPDNAVEAGCEEIARSKRFLQEEGMAEWPDGTLSGRYTFRHRLYKDVAYRRIAAARCVQWHGRIAERAERGYADQAEDIAGELALHFERGRQSLKAAHYLQIAARNALRRRGVPTAAIAIAEKGLELLTDMRETTERISAEIELHITLGNALIAVGRLSEPRVGQAFARAQALCEQVNNLPQRFRALFWLRRFHNYRGENREAVTRARELVQLAEHDQDPGLLTLAYLSIGETLWYGGHLIEAKEYLERSIDFYDRTQHQSLTFLYGTDPITGSMIYQAICLWFLGYRKRSLDLANEALALAPQLDHPFSVAFIKLHTTIAYHALREPGEVETRAEEIIGLSTEYGFAFYQALGTVLKGWALAMRGDDKGTAYASGSLKDLQAIEVGVGRTWALALLADIYGIVGQPKEGLRVVQEALDIAPCSGERFYEAELYRLKGELLLQQAKIGKTNA